MAGCSPQSYISSIASFAEFARNHFGGNQSFESLNVTQEEFVEAFKVYIEDPKHADMVQNFDKELSETNLKLNFI